jgi:hypothetical protein
MIKKQKSTGVRLPIKTGTGQRCLIVIEMLSS